MNWEAIGAIAEGVGAAGVIASLLYLAVQVRSSTRASAVEAKLRTAEMLHVFIDRLIRDPELNDIYLRGLGDIESLSKSDYYRFTNLALNSFWLFSANHFQYRTGALSENDWFEPRAIMLYWLRRPGCRVWWKKLGRSSFGPEFREYVDSEIAALDAT